jgi:hypothetical protein
MSKQTVPPVVVVRWWLPFVNASRSVLSLTALA